MDAISEFFAMGGYGAYVWPSFGISALVMIVLLLVSLRDLKEDEATFETLKSQDPRAARTANGDETQA